MEWYSWIDVLCPFLLAASWMSIDDESTTVMTIMIHASTLLESITPCGNTEH